MSSFGFFRWLFVGAFVAASAGCASQGLSGLPAGGSGGSAAGDASMAFTAGHLYVLEFGAGGMAVVEYPIHNGIPAAKPDRAVRGLVGPNAIAFDSSGDLYVLDGRVVKEFAPGANGRAHPINQIVVPLNLNIGALAVDTNGYLYVGQKGQVYVYAPGASGKAKPIAKIKPVGYPSALAIGVNNSLYALGNTQRMHPQLQFQMHVSVFQNPAMPRLIRGFCSQWLPNHGIDYGIVLNGEGRLFTTHPYFINSAPHGEIDIYPAGDAACPSNPMSVITTTNPSLLGPVYLALNGLYLYVYDLDYGNGGVVFTLQASGGSQTPLSTLYVRDNQPHNVQGIAVGP